MLKNLEGLLIGIAIIILIVFAAAIIGISIYGLVLAFHVSVLLGLVILVIEPAPLVIGLAALLGRPDFCQKIVEFFPLLK